MTICPPCKNVSCHNDSLNWNMLWDHHTAMFYCYVLCSKKWMFVAPPPTAVLWSNGCWEWLEEPLECCTAVFITVSTKYPMNMQCKDTKPAKMKPGSKWCLGNVNIDTPMYEKIKFSAKKFSNSKSFLVRDLESIDRLL